MTRQEAYEAMKNGSKVTHSYFNDDEYYEFKNNSIIAEDGVDHTFVFWSEDNGNWRETGWEIYNDDPYHNPSFEDINAW
jgi:hypothetical protein